MRSHPFRSPVQAIAVAAAVAASACGDDRAPAAPTPVAPAPTVQFVSVEPSQLRLPDIGATQQLRAVGILSDQTQRDVTADVSWSSDTRFLTIARGGLAQAVGYGTGVYTATYPGVRAATGSFAVEVPQNLKVALTGVVRDQLGRPVPAAAITVASGNVDRVSATSDGNGFFDLGTAYGTVRFHVAKFGYDNLGLTILDVAAQPRVEVTLVENPSPAIERVIEDDLQGTYDAPATRTHRIVPRPGTALDLMVEISQEWEGGGTTVELYNGDVPVVPRSFAQNSWRFTVDRTAAECRLVLIARQSMRYRVTYREAR